MEFGGACLKKGQMISALNGAANRDPAVFPDPHVFDIRRSPNKHLSFGHGPHQCLGAPLARLEAALAFPRLLGRLPDLTLDGERKVHEFFGVGFDLLVRGETHGGGVERRQGEEVSLTLALSRRERG